MSARGAGETDGPIALRRIAIATATAMVLAVALLAAAGEGSQDAFESDASNDSTARAIAWVHRYDGALGAVDSAAASLEVLERHRDESGGRWTLIRCGDDGRRAILEHRQGRGRWWIFAEARRDDEVPDPKLSDPRSRAAWRVRPGVHPVATSAGDLRSLRDELQRWRQRSPS